MVIPRIVLRLNAEEVYVVSLLGICIRSEKFHSPLAHHSPGSLDYICKYIFTPIIFYIQNISTVLTYTGAFLVSKLRRPI